MTMIRNPLNRYVRLAVHEGQFNPFDPDALGALREAYAWITQPVRSGGEEVVYSSTHYDSLTEMLRRAIVSAGGQP